MINDFDPDARARVINKARIEYDRRNNVIVPIFYENENEEENEDES